MIVEYFKLHRIQFLVPDGLAYPVLHVTSAGDIAYVLSSVPAVYTVQELNPVVAALNDVDENPPQDKHPIQVPLVVPGYLIYPSLHS